MIESADFYQKDGKPVVAMSFCVVADLLGLKARVAGCEGVEDLNSLCTYLAVLFVEATDSLSGFEESRSRWQPWAYQVFSDTLLLGYPILRSEDAGEPELGQSLDFVQWFQCRMALGGFSVCGGLSIGYLHLSSGHCFGPALIEAHEIEQQSPKFPRITVSCKVQSLIYKQMTFYTDAGQSPQATCGFLVDAGDDRIFVNYLSWANLGPVSDMALLEEHRDVIVAELSAADSDEHILCKIKWARDYHNFFCSEFIQGTEEYTPSCTQVQELLIPTDNDEARIFRRLAERRSSGLTGKCRLLDGPPELE